MPHKLKRKVHALIGAGSDPTNIDHAPGRKKSKRNLPQLDQSSDVYTQSATPKDFSPKQGGGQASHIASGDDDADGDVSSADAAEPDDESDEDGEGDAFAPSDRAIEEHGDQAGHISDDISQTESILDRKPSPSSTAFQEKSNTAQANITVGDSDSDVYNHVDLISESEADEPNVEQVEERKIIESEEAHDLNTTPANVEASDGWEGFELDDGFFPANIPFFDEQYDRTDRSILESEMALFQSANIFDELPSPSPPSPSPRRVRFKEPISQLSNDSDMDSDSRDINVLFNPVAAPIVPSGGDSNIDGQCQDHEGDDASSVGSSSGYETDYGDTTSEEDIPASATKRPQSLLHHPSLSSLVFETPSPAASKAKSSSSLPGYPSGYRRGPRMGTWIVESTKPRAVIDSTANSITNTANASPTASQQTSAAVPENSAIDPSGVSAEASMYDYNDPVLAPASDIVAASTPLPTGHSRQTIMARSYTTPSIFVPLDAMGDVGSFSEDEYLNDDDDDDDALLNIDDFIDFGDDSSEDGDQAGGDGSAQLPIAAEGPSPAHVKAPSPDASLASDDLMKHLDKHIVSAFRRGQSHHPPQPRPRHGNLALSSYALKGKRQAVNNGPMGSQKKRKMSGTLGHRPSFGLPAAKRRLIQHY